MKEFRIALPPYVCPTRLAAFLFLPFLLGRLGFLFLYGSDLSQLSGGQAAWGLIEGMRFDFSSIAIFSLLPLLAFVLPFRFGQQPAWRFFWGLILTLEGVAALAFLLGDLAYYPFVRRHLSFELNLLGQQEVSVMTKLAWQGFKGFLGLFLLGAALVLLSGFKLARSPWKPVPFKALVPLFFLFALVGRGGWGPKPISVMDAYAKGNAAYANLILNGVFTASQAAWAGTGPSHEHMLLAEAYRVLGLRQKPFPLTRSYPGKEGKRPNLIFIFVESLSSRYVGLLNPGQVSLTPNLDRIFAGSHLFTRQYAAGQRSLEGLQAVLTGIPSLRGMPTLGVGVIANSPRLGHMLASNGYETLFVQAMERKSFRGEAVAGFTGFAHYYGKEDMSPKLAYPDLDQAIFGWDYETFFLTLEKIKKLQQPFAAFMVTSSTHTPYIELPPGLARFPHNAESEGGFKNSLIYTDWALGEFLRACEKEPWFANTLFVITADHAQPHYGQGIKLLDFFNTPLAFYQPSAIKPVRDGQIASQLDILPSLADFLGLKGEWGFWGHSLFRERKKAAAWARNGDLQLLITEQGYLRHSLTQALEKPTDPQLAQELTQRLLASDQVAYELLKANRWQKP